MPESILSTGLRTLPAALSLGAAVGGAAFIGAHVHAMFSLRSPLLGARDWRLPASKRRRAALTFDDGPDRDITPRVLDLLDAHGVRATFFMIGVCVNRSPALAAEVARRGHTIANHSMSHRHDGIFRGGGYWRREIVDAERAIVDATGLRTRWFRPPLGQRNLRQSLAVTGLGYRTVGWSCRSFDAVETSPERVLARIDRARRGRDIVLMHDGVDPRRSSHRPIVLAVLPELLKRLHEENVELVTLVDMLPSPPYADIE